MSLWNGQMDQQSNFVTSQQADYMTGEVKLLLDRKSADIFWANCTTLSVHEADHFYLNKKLCYMLCLFQF